MEHKMKKGTYVIVRARDAGVHAGEYVSHSGRDVELTNSRRLYRYRNKGNYLSLSGVAKEGVSEEHSKIAPVVEHAHILDACEILECTPEAEETIRSASEER